MVFPELQESIQQWRFTTPTSGWADPYWVFLGNITGRFEPIQGNETFLQNQSFSDVSEYLLTDIDYKLTIQPGDGFVDVDGIQRKVVGQPEIWKSFLPHVACKMQRTQWTVVS
jgi:hypothetical protein